VFLGLPENDFDPIATVNVKLITVFWLLSLKIENSKITKIVFCFSIKPKIECFICFIKNLTVLEDLIYHQKLKVIWIARYEYKYLDVPSVHVVFPSVVRNVAYKFLSMCRIWFKKQGLLKVEMLLVADKAWGITIARCTWVRRTRYVSSSDSDSTFKEVPVNLLEKEDIDKEKSCLESSSCFLFNKIFKQSWSWLRRAKSPSLKMKRWSIFPQRLDKDCSLIKTA